VVHASLDPWQAFVLRILHARHKVGFHAFRRFRASVLRKARVPEDLLRMWLGHESKSVTDDYALQIREDPQFRREWAQLVGLGFSIASDERCSTSGVTTPNSVAA
jgi:integrase